MMMVRDALEGLNVDTFMVDAKPGQDFGEQTTLGLHSAAAMVAFCTSTYGEKTGAGYETYEELKYAHESNGNIFLIPLKLNPQYPPQPPGREGRALCQLVFSRSKVFIDGLETGRDGDLRFKPAKRVAKEIWQCLKDADKLSLVTDDPILDLRFASPKTEEEDDSEDVAPTPVPHSRCSWGLSTQTFMPNVAIDEPQEPNVATDHLEGISKGREGCCYRCS